MTKIALFTSVAALATALSPATAATLRTAAGIVYTNARQGVPAGQQRVIPFAATKIYAVDDGTAEDAVGFGDGSQNFAALWFNQFTTVTGGEAISSVQIVWGTPADPNSPKLLNNKHVTIAIWSDPNGDGNPSDAKLIGKVAGKITSADTDTFVTYTFAKPVYVGPKGTSFFVGDETPAYTKQEVYFQGIDETTDAAVSWVSAMSDGSKPNLTQPGKNDLTEKIDDAGLPGNWLIRATGVKSSGK